MKYLPEHKQVHVLINQRPDPNVKFALVNETRVLNVLLNNKLFDFNRQGRLPRIKNKR
jgi:hypothetical protein